MGEQAGEWGATSGLGEATSSIMAMRAGRVLNQPDILTLRAEPAGHPHSMC